MVVILPRFILDEKTNDSYFKIMNHGCNSPGGGGDTQQLYSGKWNRQAGAELCQAQHSLSLDLATN